MPRAPRVTGRELVTLLGRLGFAVTRIRGSHHFLRHRDGRATTVPVHGRETLGPGLLAKILRDCELEPDDLNSGR